MVIDNIFANMHTEATAMVSPARIHKCEQNEQDKMEREKAMRPQLYLKNFMQLRKARKRKGDFY